MTPGTIRDIVVRLPGVTFARSEHYECRRCGTTIEEPDADCPYCGDADVVRFDLD